MRFIGKLLTWEFKPCPDCQKKIRELMETAGSVTIGNEKYEHPVEFNRRIVDDDKTFFPVAKHHPPTPEESKQIGEHWVYEEITKEAYDKTAIIGDN